MMEPFDCDPQIREALQYAERAIGGMQTLHLGPLDYNVHNTVDYLRTAAAIIEQYGQTHRSTSREIGDDEQIGHMRVG